MGKLCETQTCKHSRVVIDINPCTNECITQPRTNVMMVSIGQPQHETILEEKGHMQIMGNRKYKNLSKNLIGKKETT